MLACINDAASTCARAHLLTHLQARGWKDFLGVSARILTWQPRQHLLRLAALLEAVRQATWSVTVSVTARWLAWTLLLLLKCTQTAVLPHRDRLQAQSARHTAGNRPPRGNRHRHRQQKRHMGGSRQRHQWFQQCCWQKMAVKQHPRPSCSWGVHGKGMTSIPLMLCSSSAHRLLIKKNMYTSRLLVRGTSTADVRSTEQAKKT